MKNLKITHKIIFSMLVIVSLSLLMITAYNYYNFTKRLETTLGDRLENISRTASLLISAEDHKKIEEAYLNQEKNINQLSSFKKIQSTLRRIKETNELQSEIYTLILPDWAPGHMIFIVMSDEKTYIGNALPATEDVKQVFKDGRHRHTQLYQDKEGTWISALSPIKDQAGAVVAVIELDYSAQKEIAAAKLEIFKQLLPPSIVGLLVSLMIGAILGRIISQPVIRLSQFAQEVQDGNLDAEIQARSTDEVGILTETFSATIKELKKNRNDLKEYAHNLEIERDKALKANQAKSQFLANMSHEIRTPLNGMIGLLDLLKRSPLSSDQKEHVSIVSQSSRLLLTIINEILEFSKIEAGKLDLEVRKFNLKKCVEDIVNVLANEAYRKGLELPIYIDEKIPDRVKSDEARIRQILLNLIGNAIKFTPEGEISVSLSMQGDNHLLFEVEDTGIGIPSNKLETIFQSFSQADISDTRKYGGTGLGLTISRKIVEAMKGKIWVESEEAKGSRFSFVIPLERVNDLDPPAKIDFKKEKEVLLLMKSKRIQSNIVKYVQGWNCNIIQYRTLELLYENFEKLSRKSIVLLDASFITLEESELFLRIKEVCDDRGARIVIATQPSSKASLQKEKALDGVHMLTKPVGRDSIYKVLSGGKDLSFNSTKPSKSVSRNSSNVRLLLVEDNLINQQVAVAMLASGGYKCEIANNGQEAVDHVQKSDYDLILMDCQMPVMDGFDATQAIRQMEEESKRHIPIVAMTANAFRKTKEQCFDVGMDAFITKPVTAKDLIATIEENLKKAG